MQPQYQNQLQFNLAVPATERNLAVRYQRPGPIIIEKCGGNLSGVPIKIQNQPPKAAFEVNSGFEDSMNVALMLAKRDLKQKRFEESLREMQQKEKPAKAKGKLSATQTAKSKKRLDKEKSKVILIKEREISKETKSTKTQTRKKPGSSNPVVYLQRDLPVRSMSPPTHDVDPGSAAFHASQQERLLTELKRLRKDVQKSLQQTQDLERKARLGQLMPAPRDLELDERRRGLVRAEEQAVRSARTLYSLQKQVQDIQTELLTLGSASQGEKNQALARLASAHRSAARMLKGCINQQPDQAHGPGFSKTCRELTLLVRQLSLCCTQLQVYSDSDIPDDVAELVNQATAFSDQLDEELQNTPPSKSPASRNLFPREADKKDKITKKSAVIKERLPAYEVKMPKKESVRQEGRQKQKLVEATRKHYRDIGVERSPERDQALRAGIAALTMAADSPVQQQQQRADVPPLNLPPSPRTTRARNRPPAKNKGLLLPSQLQAKRERALRVRVNVDDAHFAEPTVSSRMKQVAPLEDEPELPAPQSPRRDQSPRGRSYNPNVSARSDGPEFDRLRRDVARQVMKDQQSAIQGRPGTPKKSVINVDFIEEVERRIEEKLKPLLDKAQVGVNVDLLGDMVLHDVLADTAQELQRIEADDRTESDVIQLQDAPDVSLMLRRLEEMEREQDDIRKRWASLAYEDEFSERINTATSVAVVQEPISPEPIEITCSGQGQERPIIARGTTMESTGSVCPAVLDVTELEGIRFTKQAPVPAYQQRSLHVSDLRNDRRGQEVKDRSRKIPVFLSKQMISSINHNKIQFEHYLENTAHQPMGKFDPWSIVNELADDILDECMKGVSNELDEISTDMAEHVYKSEFTGPTERNQPVNTPSNDTQGDHHNVQ